MAISRDAFAMSTFGVASSKTWSHTCASGSVLFVWCHTEASASTLTATYNAVAMTQITSVTIPTGGNAGRKMYAWYILAPTSGANNVVVTGTASGFMGGGSISYLGADSSTQPDASASAQDGTSNGGAGPSSISTTITTVNSGAWIGAMAIGSSTSMVGTGSLAATPLQVTSDGAMLDSNGTVSVGGQSVGSSWASTNAALFVAVSIKPVASVVPHSLSALGVGT